MAGLPSRTTWYLEHISPDLIQAASLQQFLYTGRTQYQDVSLIETTPFGRMLVLDGKTQSSEADEFIYHEGLVQPAMLAHTHPRQVFIAGGGEGATAREVLRHRSVQQVHMVDLDSEVVELCRQYLPNHHAGAFDDPRLRLHFQDAYAYLEQTSDRFDVIIIDIPDPLEGGPAYLLYTQEFYGLVRSRLGPGGMMVVQSGPAGPTNYAEVFTAIYHTAASIFPQTFPYRLYVPSFGSMWGFVVGALDDAPAMTAMAIGEIDRRSTERLVTPLRFYDGITHTSIFALPKYLRQAMSAEQRLITRDAPLFAI